MLYEVIVIGGGPVGLYMCKLLEENNKNYLLIEETKNVGGQCKNIYPNKHMYDIPGLGAITGGDFIDLLLSNIKDTNIHVNEQFITYTKENNILHITTNKNTYTCKNIIITTGMGACVFNKPIIEGLELYENKQIFYFPENPTQFTNKQIVIFGGGDTAIDAVESLYKNNSISIVHRRNTFKAMTNKLYLLSNIKAYIPYNLKLLNSCQDNKEKLVSVIITNHDSKEDFTLECDYIFFCYGYNTGINPEKILVDIKNMMSDVHGVFVIGGASVYEQKRELITSGMFEARIVLNQLL